jgi:hypothetical protein
MTAIVGDYMRALAAIRKTDSVDSRQRARRRALRALDVMRAAAANEAIREVRAQGFEAEARYVAGHGYGE